MIYTTRLQKLLKHYSYIDIHLARIVYCVMRFETAVVAFLILLFLKLSGAVTWPWIWVTAPLWVPIVVPLFLLSLIAILLSVALIVYVVFSLAVELLSTDVYRKNKRRFNKNTNSNQTQLDNTKG